MTNSLLSCTLQNIKEHSMNIIGTKIYLPVKSDIYLDDLEENTDNKEISVLTVKNIEFTPVIKIGSAECSEYPITNIQLNQMHLFNGAVTYDMLGKTAFLSGENAEKALKQSNDFEDDTEYIKSELEILRYYADTLFNGNSAYFCINESCDEDDNEKWETIEMPIISVSVLTSSIVPGRNYRNSHGGLFLTGKDQVGQLQQEFGVMCFESEELALQKINELKEV